MAATVLKRAIDAGEQILEKAQEAPDLKTAVKRGVDTAEDLMEDAVHEMKRHPLRTVSTGFVLGLVTGVLGGWLVARAIRR